MLTVDLRREQSFFNGFSIVFTPFMLN